MQCGAPACRFAIVKDRTEPLARHERKKVDFKPRPLPELPASNIDAQKIVQALVDMPIHGNTEGLIPAFGVYLASYFTRTVAWRDRKFHVDRQGHLTLEGDSTA